MSDTALDLKEQLARIDKLREEALKLAAEQHKLSEEALKLRRDRLLAPGLVIAALIGSIGAIALSIARALGWMP